MSKSLIVYFSQIGATARVAESIAKGLQTSGYQVDLHNLKIGVPPDFMGYDLLGIGSPVYYYTQPYNITDYIYSLSGLEGLPIFTFNTYAVYQFDAGSFLLKILRDKGAVLMGHFSCRGAASYLGYEKRDYLFSSDYPKVENLAKAVTFEIELAGRVAGKPYILLEGFQRAPWIYRLEPFLATRWLIRHVYSRLFSVDKKTCNGCGICVKICPTQNIKRDHRGRITWQRNCIGCFMCQMNAPEMLLAL